MLRTLTTALSLAAMMNAALACTAVDIVAADRTVIAGRTMEWAFDMKWTLVSRPKGFPVKLTAPKALNLPERTVEAKYALVGVSANIIPGGALVEGQNAAGLGLSGNFLPGFTTYQTVTPQDKNYVEVLSFGAWALGNFATIAEVKEALKTTKVWSDPSAASGPTAPLMHFVFTDRAGASIIVEYVEGELHIHDNVAHVLTNAPTYDWHLTNLRNYLNLSTVGVEQRQIGNVDVTALGQGGGLVGLPGDYTPPSRFVRASALRHGMTPPKDGAEAVQAVVHVLNTVDIPVGVAQSRLPNGQLVSDYTQWVSIKDLTNNRLQIADYAHRTSYLTIDLAPLFALDRPAERLITDLPYPAGVGADVLKP